VLVERVDVDAASLKTPDLTRLNNDEFAPSGGESFFSPKGTPPPPPGCAVDPPKPGHYLRYVTS